MAYITWAGKVDVTESTNSSLTKTGGGSGWNAGAYSTEEAASGNIKVEFKIPYSPDPQGSFGIGNVTDAQAGEDLSGIAYGLTFQYGDVIYIEGGSFGSAISTYTTDDLFSVEVDAGEVIYRKNGGASLRTVSSPTLDYPLCVDCSFEQEGQSFEDCTIEFPVDPAGEMSGTLSGATTLSGTMTSATSVLRGSTELTGTMSAVRADEPSLTIFVDILDSAIVAAQASNLRRYNSRLLVDSVEIPIRSATLDARKDSLGIELRVVLAIADTTQVSFTSEFTFDLGIWTGSWTWLTLLAGGKLSSLENPIKNDQNRPADEVSISIVDVIADRWNRAPRAPIHLYDPDQASPLEQSQIAAQRIELQDGTVIEPVNTPITGMTLQNVLDEAYVTGTGFDSVVTNIPDFPVAETEFTLAGGYDAGVRPLLSLFAPLLFERNNVLFVIDPDGPLPSGFTPRSFAQSLTRELTDSLPQREPVNSLLLKYKDDVAGDYYEEREITADPIPAGVFGTPSYTETTIEKRVREYRTFAAPAIIVRTEEVSETTTVVDFEFNPIEITVLIQTYDHMGRKTGHSRRVSKLMPDLNSAFIDPVDNSRQIPFALLDDVLRQEQAIVYKPNPLNAAEDVQDSVTTVESGLILVDPAYEYVGRTPDEAFRIPLTDAHVSGFVDAQNEDQFVETGDIKTTTECLRVHGQQVNVECRVVNHIANAATQTSLTTRPGTVTTNRKKQAASRTMLLIVPGTDGLGRRAQTLDAGILPSDIAIDLAERKLRRLNDPPRQLALTPAYVDVSIKRGTLLDVHARADVLVGTYIVESWSIQFAEFQAETGSAVSMRVTAREVKP